MWCVVYHCVALEDHLGDVSKRSLGHGAGTRFLTRRLQGGTTHVLLDATGGIEPGQLGDAVVVVDTVGLATGDGSEEGGTGRHLLGLGTALFLGVSGQVGTGLASVVALVVALDGIVVGCAGSFAVGAAIGFAEPSGGGGALVGVLAGFLATLDGFGLGSTGFSRGDRAGIGFANFQSARLTRVHAGSARFIATLHSRGTLVFSTRSSTKLHGTDTTSSSDTGSTRLVTAFLSLVTSFGATGGTTKLSRAGTSGLGTLSTRLVTALQTWTTSLRSTGGTRGLGARATGCNAGSTALVATLLAVSTKVGAALSTNIVRITGSTRRNAISTALVAAFPSPTAASGSTRSELSRRRGGLPSEKGKGGQQGELHGEISFW